jgi:hypothetical protein
MAKGYYGSIDFSKLMEQAKAGNKAFKKSENGKIYLSVRVWVNDDLDKYGNIASLQATFKDATKDEKFYFGNLKESTPVDIPVTGADIIDADDLPY